MSRSRRALVVFFVSAIVYACGQPSKETAAQPAVPKAVEQARAAAATPVPATPMGDVQRLLTPDNLAKYVVFEQEMIPAVPLSMAIAAEAYKRGGTAKSFEETAKTDPRAKQVEDIESAAAAKSGLSVADARMMGRYLSEYISKRAFAGDAEKPGLRAEFEKTYGAAAATAVDGVEAALIENSKKTAEAALAAPKAK